MLLKSRLSVLLAVAVLPLAGCGDSSSGSGDAGADPAAVVPAAAPVYLEAVVRPDGDLKSGANDALKKLLRTDDPSAKLVGLVNKALASGHGNLTWDDFKDWLGPRVGVYLSKIDGKNTVGALIADTTDAGKAKDGLDKIVKASSGDVTSAMVGDYAVVGSAQGVKDVQAAAADGAKTLADAPDFQAARDAASGDDSLGLAYVAPQGLLDAFKDMTSAGGANPFSDPQSLAVFRQLFAKAGRAAAVTLHADGDALRMEGASIGGSAASATSAATDSLSALPADAWLAIGFGDIGKTLTDGLAQMSQLTSLARPSGGPDFEALLGAAEKKLGIDIRQDFLSWMGDGAVYARGHSIADIGGALTIKSTNAAKSRRAVGILAQGLAKAGANVRPAKVDGYNVAVEVRSAQAPISLFIAANDDRFTVGVNPQAMSDIIDPDKKLGDSDTYGKAVDTLGADIKPFVLIDTPTIINLLESFGIDQAQGFAKVKPYLDMLGPISAGSAHDGDVSRFAFALGLR